MSALSKFGTLNTRDFVKGLFMAAFGAAIGIIQSALQDGTNINWKTVLISALVAAVSYLVKNLLTNSNDQIFRMEPPPPSNN